MLLSMLPPPDDDAPGSAKAELDQGEASRAAQKVDLDLDDAPFLEDEDEDEAPAQAAPQLEAAAPKEKKPLPGWMKSKIVLFGLPLLLLLVAVAVWFLTRPKAPPVEAEPPKAEAPKPEAAKPEAPKAVPKAPPPPPPPSDTLIRMDPFLVEQAGDNGTVRFLSARFSLLTKDDKSPVEYQRKIYILRDAVYYYLRNKNLQYLTDRNNTERLKKDVLGVVNQHMGSTQFDNLLIEEYLVK